MSQTILQSSSMGPLAAEKNLEDTVVWNLTIFWFMWYSLIMLQLNWKKRGPQYKSTVVCIFIAFLLLWYETMTKEIDKRKCLMWIIWSQRVRALDHPGKKHGGRQAGMVLGQWLRIHILFHKHGAERQQTGKGMSLSNLKLHPY